MDKILRSWMERAKKSNVTGYRREKLKEAIFLAGEILKELKDLNKDRRSIHGKIIQIMILFGAGGLFD